MAVTPTEAIPQGQHLLLFENCQLTKGASRTLLLDLQRNEIEFLDNALYPIFTGLNRQLPFAELLQRYTAEEQEALTEYAQYFVQKEYAFWCDADEVALFPTMALDWDEPAVITNAIIDFDREPDDLAPYVQFIEELNALGCENIQLRSFTVLGLPFWQRLLDHFNHTAIFRIEILTQFPGNLDGMKEFVQQQPRLNELVLHSATGNYDLGTDTDQRVRTTRVKVTGQDCCGLVSPRLFNLNQEHFLESQRHNTCLNRKVSVDVAGHIKNCPSMRRSFGQLGHTPLAEVVAQPEFQATWGIHKGLVTDCQVCEFRHICTDCRAFLDADTSTAKPKKCGYNPYTNTWADGTASEAAVGQQSAGQQ